MDPDLEKVDPNLAFGNYNTQTKEQKPKIDTGCVKFLSRLRFADYFYPDQRF